MDEDKKLEHLQNITSKYYIKNSEIKLIDDARKTSKKVKEELEIELDAFNKFCDESFTADDIIETIKNSVIKDLSGVKRGYVFSEYDRQIFSNFRFSIDENFRRLTHVKIQSESATYKSFYGGLEEALIGTNQYRQKETEYYDLIDKLYKDGKQVTKLIYGTSIEENAGKKYVKALPFEEYLGLIEQHFLRDEKSIISEPKIISNIATEPAFFHHIESTTTEDTNTKEWDDWLLCMPEACRPVFRAYIASIFDGKNEGRRALYLYGQGLDGKTQMTKALQEYMKNIGVGSISSLSMKRDFATSSVYGKRLLIYGDNKNPKIMHSELMHSILGGDILPIEFKGEKVFTAKIHSKVIVCANIKPEINLHERNETSRISFIPLSEPPIEVMQKFCEVNEDGSIRRYSNGEPVTTGYNLTEKLVEQMPAFLEKCKVDYARLAPTRQSIIQPAEMIDLLHNFCESPEHEMFSYYTGEFLEITNDENDYIASRILREHFCEKNRGVGLKDNNVYSRYLKFLELNYNLVNKKRRVEQGNIHVLSGVKLRNAKLEALKSAVVKKKVERRAAL